MPSTLETSSPDPHGRALVYDPMLQWLHWGILMLLIVQYMTKLIPPNVLAGASEESLNKWHLAIGPSILALMLLRLAWRLTHPVPPPPADLSLGLQLVSRATHWTLYGLLILLPILGWFSASGFGATPYLFDLIPLPALVARNKDFAEMIGGVHGFVAWILLAVIALHVCGALYHATIKRDGVMQRILPLGSAETG